MPVNSTHMHEALMVYPFLTTPTAGMAVTSFLGPHAEIFAVTDGPVTLMVAQHSVALHPVLAVQSFGISPGP